MIGGMQVAKVNRRRNVESGQLPPGTALDTVDNPYDVGPAKIVALRSFRGDPLALMLSRKQIDKAQFEAGRAWQRLYRAAEIVSVQAMDPTKEPVDGGGGVIEALTDRKVEAMKRMMALGIKLGAPSVAMLNHILIAGMGLREYTHAFDWPTAHATKAMGRRFRDTLEKLAKEFGYA